MSQTASRRAQAPMPAPHTPPLLQAESLRKRYGDREVVQGVDLQLHAGEIVGLLGPNGAGKSTTVAMLCGLVTPDAGRCLIEGAPLQGDADPRKSRIGLVSQDLALYEPLSARDNLRTFGGLYGLSGRTLQARVADALQLAGLEDRAQDPVHTFSGGMKRRLHIAIALLHEPSVVILDEPTTGVDPQSRNAIFDTLERLRDAGKALLYTTHYMEEAERLCQRLLIMDHGRVMAEGDMATLMGLLPTRLALHLELDAELHPEVALAWQAMPGVVSVVPGDGRDAWRVTLQALEVAAEVLQAAQRHHSLRHLHTERPTLEQVFLHLTGRALRDAA